MSETTKLIGGVSGGGNGAYSHSLSDSGSGGRKDGLPPPASGGTATFYTSVFNLSNTIVGSGILALPQVFARCGLVVGSIFLLLGSAAAAFGLRLLVECAVRSQQKTTSYFIIAQHTFPKARYVIDLAVALKCFGVASSYLIVIGNLVPEVLPEDLESQVLKSHRLWISIFMLVILPLALARELKSLRFISMAALMAVAYLTCLVWFFFFYLDRGLTGVEWDVVLWPRGFTDVIKSLPVIVFAFTCHQNIFSIHSEMRGSSLPRTTGVVLVSVACCLSCYASVAVLGYITFAATAIDKSNLLLLFPAGGDTKGAVTLARLLIAVLAAFSYPLQIHPAKISTDNLLFGWKKTQEKGDPGAPRRQMAIAFCLCCVTYGVAMLVTDLGIVFSLVGATGSTALCYLLPGLFFLKMHRDQSGVDLDDEEAGKRDENNKSNALLSLPPRGFGAVGLVTVGLSMMGLANGVVIWSAASGK